MDRLEKTRLSWIKLYKEVKDTGLVCCRCGISRPTLRKWLQRYEKSGVDGLKELSRKPHNCQSKITAQQEKLILSLRNERKLGVRWVQSEIKILHDISLSLATIHKIFSKQYTIFAKEKALS
ncbi:helix-turn-helix domain-containing protein [Candidatus Tisiphia endosymbiont of Parasteatoda lunata]|uniref:helix-turn-helix domain-containing protein n=1 Tax=Candidatus Tisiphia endosymbiont of Parasteatoda lunata TaxID=3066275 RepID=UPI00313C2F4A